MSSTMALNRSPLMSYLTRQQIVDAFHLARKYLICFLHRFFTRRDWRGHLRRIRRMPCERQGADGLRAWCANPSHPALGGARRLVHGELGAFPRTKGVASGFTAGLRGVTQILCALDSKTSIAGRGKSGTGYDL